MYLKGIFLDGKPQKKWTFEFLLVPKFKFTTVCLVSQLYIDWKALGRRNDHKAITWFEHVSLVLFGQEFCIHFKPEESPDEYSYYHKSIVDYSIYMIYGQNWHKDLQSRGRNTFDSNKILSRVFLVTIITFTSTEQVRTYICVSSWMLPTN